MTERTVTLPTVHMNGDTANTLCTQNWDAALAVEAAIDAVQKAAPNARNFYVQADPDAFRKAQDEHQVRLKALNAIYLDLTRIVQHTSPDRSR